VRIPDAARERRRRGGDDDRVDVVRHQAPREELEAGFSAVLSHEREV
jgi:hypothetical protein